MNNVGQSYLGQVLIDLKGGTWNIGGNNSDAQVKLLFEIDYVLVGHGCIPNFYLFVDNRLVDCR